MQPIIFQNAAISFLFDMRKGTFIYYNNPSSPMEKNNDVVEIYIASRNI